MHKRNISMLAGLAALFYSAKGHSASIPMSIGDESVCVFTQAYKLLQASEWSHLTLEPKLYYYKGALNSSKQYTIYAHSSTNTPKKFKLKVTAYYDNAKVGSCYLSDEAELWSSDGKRVLFATIKDQENDKGKRVGVEVNFDQLSPSDFPLEAGTDPTPVSSFEDERKYEKATTTDGEKAAGENTTVLGIDTKKSHTITIPPLDDLKEQGKRGAVDVGGLVARRYLWKLGTTAGTSPAANASKKAKVARSATGVVLWGDLAARGWYTIVEGTDPGDIAVFKGASELGGKVLDAVGTSSIATGKSGAIKVSEVAYKKILNEGLKEKAEAEKARTELERQRLEERKAKEAAILKDAKDKEEAAKRAEEEAKLREATRRQREIQEKKEALEKERKRVEELYEELKKIEDKK